jgi:hypothetical protein
MLKKLRREMDRSSYVRPSWGAMCGACKRPGRWLRWLADQTTLSEPDVRLESHCGLKSDITPWRDLQVNGEAGGRVRSGRSLWRQLGFDIELRRGPFNPKMHPPMAPGKHLLQCELAHTVSAELRVM